MDWGNAFVRAITGTSPITALELELNLTGDFKRTEKKITWLSSPPSSSLVPVVLLDYDYLIIKKKLAEEDKVDDFVTPVTEFQVPALGDYNLRDLKRGDAIQFEKKGYYIVDKAIGETSVLLEGKEGEERMELISIPDGKVASIASKAATVALIPTIPAIASSQSKKAAVGEVIAVGRIPTPAPSEAVETTLLSNGNTGFDILVKTKMFRVPSVYGDDGVEAIADTKMFKVKPVYDL
jgi:glutamyl-tRNA synthetase